MKKIFFIFFCFASIFLFTNCNSSSNKSKSAKSDCISKGQAQYAVSEYLTIQGVNATWDTPTAWQCSEKSNGWSVDAILYMSGGQVNRTYFVDCSGNVQ